MTDPTLPPPVPVDADGTVSNESAGAKMAVEYGPILVFVLLYNYLRRSDPDGAIFTAASVFAVVAVLAMLYSKVKLGKLSGLLMLTTAIVVISVGLAYFFDDPRFIYMKPTVVNAILGVGVIGGVLIGKNVAELLFNGAFQMGKKHWNTFSIRWGLFFFFCAALNEVIWRMTVDPNVPGSDAFWVNFKLFGFMPLSFLFIGIHIPYFMKHATHVDTAEENAAT